MNPRETMTWAGPLPLNESDAGSMETMTFAGPMRTVVFERATTGRDSGGPAMWAGPLPTWIERGAEKAQSTAPSFGIAATL